jgi:hypothetical protein
MTGFVAILVFEGMASFPFGAPAILEDVAPNVLEVFISIVL